MYILGISAFYHDSAACLLKDGEIIAAAQEERFTRKKHDASFPHHAVLYCLKEAGITAKDIDNVVFYEKPFVKFERLLETYLAFAPKGFTSFAKAMPVWIKDKLFQKTVLIQELKSTLYENVDWRERLLFSEHHLSHAASAYYPSPFDSAAVLTLDGVGEWTTTSLAIGNGSDLKVVREIHFPHSLGLLYSAFTYYTGFKVNSGEYKVMGLAPYGEPRYADLIREKLITVAEDGSFQLDMRYFDYATGLTMTNKKFNIGSPKQLGETLFDEMKIDGGKRSKNGSWQTSVEILENMSISGHEIADFILDWRHFSKLKSTYSDALINQINLESKRVHTSYSMVGASTGRLSSSNPNLQNIPIRTKEGRLIRTAFEAKQGFKLVSMDYSQIELRLIAHIADENKMIEAFNNELDIHADTASKVFGIPISDMTTDIRRKAKAINFGIIYGISSYGLAKQLKCSPSEAKSFINSYFDRFPKIKDYMEETKNSLYNDGYVETLFSRRIYINGGDSKNQNIRGFAERQAINAPIQGTAADIIKNAMIQIDKSLLNYNKDVSMLMQVHDELVFEIKNEKIHNIENIILPIMENANLPMVPLNVKLKVDTGYGDNWAEAH